MTEKLQEGDIVLCTVERIQGTVVFVKIHQEGSNDHDLEGSIITSEVAPGRIRNIRDYVVPKKKIVCKVLRISQKHIDLSLRRVTQKEQKEILARYKLEKSYKSVLKSVLKEKSEKIVNEINKKSGLIDFLENIKESKDSANEKILQKLVGKKDFDKILEILRKQKKKTTILNKKFSLTTTSPEGINDLKDILSKPSKGPIKIKYISAGHYSITSESENPKQADKAILELLEIIKNSAKKIIMEFSDIEKKK